MKPDINLWDKCRIHVNEDKKFEFVVLEFYVRKFLNCNFRKMAWLRNNSGIRYDVHRDDRSRRFYRIKDVYALHRSIWVWMIERGKDIKKKMPLMYYFKKELDKGGYNLYAYGNCFASSVSFERSNSKYVQDYRENNIIGKK